MYNMLVQGGQNMTQFQVRISAETAYYIRELKSQDAKLFDVFTNTEATFIVYYLLFTMTTPRLHQNHVIQLIYNKFQLQASHTILQSQAF